MLKLELQSLPSDVKSQFIGKDLILGKTEGRRRRRGQRTRLLYSITDSMDLSLSKLQMLEDRGAWHAKSLGSQRVRHDLETEQKKQLQF